MSFGFTLLDLVLRHLHYIDQHAGGEVAMDEVVVSPRQARQRFLVNSLIEEAIRSSQLEGATTERRIAEQLIRSGRKPKERSELMIVNNLRAIEFMREEMGDELSPEAVLQLHQILTDGTLDDPTAAGRLQRADEDRVAVYYQDDDEQPIHHAASHRVSHETARSDLRRLVDRGLLTERRVGRRFLFHPAPNLPERLKESDA